MKQRHKFTHSGAVLTDYGTYIFPLKEEDGYFTEFTNSIKFDKVTGVTKDAAMRLKLKSVKPFPKNTKMFLLK